MVTGKMGTHTHTNVLVNEGAAACHRCPLCSFRGKAACGSPSVLHPPPWGGWPSSCHTGFWGRELGCGFEPWALPCAETCMCLQNSSGCYLFLSRNIKMLHLLGLRKPSCKMHPKGQLSPLLLKSESRPVVLGCLQCKHGSALLGGYCFPAGKGN